MRTKRQQELIDGYLSGLTPELGAVYRELIGHLSELGYEPKKQRAAIVFNCPQHNKQIAKLGFDRKGAPFFALRFSACRGYSERFGEIVRNAVSGKNYQEPGCMRSGEDFCKGPIDQRLYTYELPGGEKRYYCGAKALAIPGLTAEDVPEAERLMDEEHRFLMEHEARKEESGA